MALEISTIIVVLVLILYLGWDIPFRQGIRYIKGRKYEQAIRLYNWLIRVAPRHSMAFSNRGYAKYRLGNQTGALEDYNRAIKLNPYNNLAIYSRAGLLSEMGEFEKALANLTDLIDRNPQEMRAYYIRGYVFSKQDNFDPAIKDFSQAINMLIDSANNTPRTNQPIESLHPLHEAQGRHRQDDALLVSCYLQRGMCFYYQEKTEKALGDVEQALKLEPQSTLAVYNRGFYRYRLGNLDLALTDYDLAIQLDDQFGYPYGGRGNCYFEKGDLLSALENFARASELESTEHYALAGLAVTHHALGEIQIAQELWRSLLEKDDQHRQPDWLAKEYGWNVPLVQEAEKLMVDL